MLRRLLVAAALLATSPTALRAQEAAARSLSIAEAMALAEEHSEAVRIARARVARARAQLTQASAGRLPQLSGSASYERTVLSEFDDLFPSDPGGGMGMDLGALPFGRDNTYRVGLSASQPLFTGGRLTGAVDVAEAGLAQAEVALAEARAQAILDASQAYYDALLGEHLLAIAEATLAQAEETAAQTRLGFEEGAQPEFDVLRAEVTRDNQRSLVTQRASELVLARMRLAQAVGLAPRTPLSLESELERPEAQPVDRFARAAAGIGTEGGRAPIERAATQVRARRAAVEVARSQRWPSIALGSQLGFVNYPVDLLPGTDDWRTNFSVGVSLEVPIFTGGRVTGEIRSAEADLLEAELRLEAATELSALDTARTGEQVEVAEALWRASLRTARQAQRAYEIAGLRFRQGVSTQLELIDARVLLQQARVNGARAARDLLVARVRRALLPKLPLDLAGAPAAPAPARPSVPASGSPQPPGRGAVAPGLPTTGTRSF